MNSKHRNQGPSSILRWNGRSVHRFFAGLLAMTTAVVLGVVVGPAAGPAFGTGSTPSTITISKQTLRGSAAKIAGASFELRPYSLGQTTPPSHAGGELGCTIASGDTSCNVTVPDTGSGQANQNKRYWVVETSAPAGTSAISSLGTGGVSAVVRANPYPGLTPALTGSAVNIPADGYQLIADSASSTNLEQSNSGSVVVNRLDDPALNVPCNSDLDVALVLDKSSSINGGGTDYRSSYAAGVGQLLDALGTSSHTKVAAFTFNTNAAKLVGLNTPAANKSTIVNNITGSSYAAATNWDAGFQAVSGDADLSKYDVVIMVTDGAPNTYGNNVSAGGVEFRAMEEAVLSANALKNGGKQILAVGVGAINNTPTEGKLNLAAISDESHDFIGDWADLGTQLSNIAKNLTCQGTVTVNKTTVNGGTTTPNATGWAFTAANTGGKGSTSDSGTQTTTGPKPSASWTYQFSDKADSTTVNLKETNQTGWQQTGIVCAGKAVAAKGDGSFDVPVTSGTNTSCTVTNTFSRGDLVIAKKDATTGSTVTVAGTEFDVKQGTTVVKHVVDNGANDADNTVGVIKVANLPTGSYTVVETTAPTGYWLPATASQDVSVTTQGGSLTFSDPRQWAPLTATKTAQGDYDTLYHWSITKGVRVGGSGAYSGTATQGSSTGSGSFNYQVQVTEGARDVSKVKVTGKISVTNNNPLPVTADLADSFGGAGWSCTVNGGTTTVAVPASKTTDYSYSCTGPDALPANGTNTATVGWSKTSYPQAQADVGASGSYSASAQADVTFTEHATNKTVTVHDDKHAFVAGDISAGTIVGGDWQLTWTLGGGPYTATYARSIAGSAGVCTSDTNVATLSSDPSNPADAKATVCVGQDLVVTKNALESLTRTYLWDIAKTSTDEGVVMVDPETGKATTHWDVTVSTAGTNDTGWQMHGTITVTNPNRWEDVVVGDVTDSYEGHVCTVAGLDTVAGRTIPRATEAGPGTKAFDYTCTFDTKPAYDGTNTAVVTWDKAAAATPTGTDDFDLAVAKSQWTLDAEYNKSVTVVDGVIGGQAAGPIGSTYTWSTDFTPQVIHYTEDLGAPAGECKTWTNVARLHGDDDVPLGDPASDTVEVCNEAALTATKDAAPWFTRTYDWSLQKQVRVAATETTPAGPWEDVSASWTGDQFSHEFDYRIQVSRAGFEDTGYSMTGTITVENPNKSADIDPKTATVTEPDTIGGVGATCVIYLPGAGTALSTSSYQITLSSGDNITLGYTCDLDGRPEGDVVNTATVAWGTGQSTTASSDPVSFTEPTTKVHDSVYVVDNSGTADPGDDHVFDPIAWADAEKGVTESYSATHTATRVGCDEDNSWTNTASLYALVPESGPAIAAASQLPPALTWDTATAAICPTAGTWTVAKTVTEPTTVPVGTTLHYTLTATKTGGVNPTNVDVVDDLTSIAPYITGAPVVTTSGADTSYVGGKLTWHVGELAGVRTLQFEVTVKGDAYSVDLPNLVTSVGSTNCPDSASATAACKTDNKTPPAPIVSPPVAPTVVVSPPKQHHPAVLPNTGGPDGLWLAGGLALLLAGGALVLGDRRRKHRS